MTVRKQQRIKSNEDHGKPKRKRHEDVEKTRTTINGSNYAGHVHAIPAGNNNLNHNEDRDTCKNQQYSAFSMAWATRKKYDHSLSLDPFFFKFSNLSKSNYGFKLFQFIILFMFPTFSEVQLVAAGLTARFCAGRRLRARRSRARPGRKRRIDSQCI